MKIYVEAYEIIGEEASEGDFIRLDATEVGVDEALKDLKSILNPSKQYIIQIHFCSHDSQGSCTAMSEEEYLKAKEEALKNPLGG
ncbi:MAG: hypothetical protein QXN08_01240 [Nitrososphaerales archaeon]